MRGFFGALALFVCLAALAFADDYRPNQVSPALPQTWTGQQTFVAPILGAATATSISVAGASLVSPTTSTLAVAGNISVASGGLVNLFNPGNGNFSSIQTPATGIFQVNTGGVTAALSIANVSGVPTFTANSIVITTPNTPADNATCVAGTIWWDTGFLYVCAVSGTVKRATLAAY